MGLMFNRLKGQGHCYVLQTHPNLKPLLLPAECGKQYHAICASTCPTAGTPVSPPPKELQEEEPLGLQTMMVRRNVAIRKHLQEAIKKAEEMTLPNITQTLTQEQLEPGIESTSNHTKRDFIGYNCSEPVDIVAIKIGPEVDVCKNT